MDLRNFENFKETNLATVTVSIFQTNLDPYHSPLTFSYHFQLSYQPYQVSYQPFILPNSISISSLISFRNYLGLELWNHLTCAECKPSSNKAQPDLHQDPSIPVPLRIVDRIHR